MARRGSSAQLVAVHEALSRLGPVDQLDEELVDMVHDRMLGRPGLKPGPDVAIQPSQPAQLAREVDPASGPTFTEGGEGRGTPRAGFSEQVLDLPGQAPHRRETREFVRVRRPRRIVDEEHDPTLRVRLERRREQRLSDDRHLLLVRGDEDRQPGSVARPIESEQILVGRTPMAPEPPEVGEAGELVHEAPVDEIDDDEEKDECSQPMRPRHGGRREDAHGHGGQGEDGGDHRHTDTDTGERDVERRAITRWRSCRVGRAIDGLGADGSFRGARRGYGAPPCQETPSPQSCTLPSVARQSGIASSPDPRLCVPASRQVCRSREGVSVRRPVLRQAPSQIREPTRVRAEPHGSMGTSVDRGTASSTGW